MTKHSLSSSGALLAMTLALAAAGCGGGTPTSPTPPPNACVFAISPASIVVTSAGQAVTIHIDTTASCAWTARTDAGWISLSATSGTGAADVIVTVSANTQTSERAATAAIAGKDLAVRQAAREATPCSYALTSPSSTYGADGGRGRLALQTAAGCAWTARADANWITLVTTTGTGPGDVVFDVARFDGTDQRQATIAVEQATFAIRQDPPPAAPCEYSVDPTALDLHWHGTPDDGLEIRINTGSRCSWTAQAGASWVELVTAGAGTGPATLRVRVSAYTAEATRSAPLLIRWPTATAGQNVWFGQEGCRYALGPSNQIVPAAGGVFRASVFGDPISTSCAIGCPWTAKASAPWIHLSGSGSGAGDDQLTYTVDANSSGAPRSGTITMQGWTLVVNQGG